MKKVIIGAMLAVFMIVLAVPYISQGADEKSHVYDDKRLLASFIYNYCSSGSQEEKAAVAAVVVNRVKSLRFPNTVSEVIYDIDKHALSGKSNAQCKSAAVDALNGWDPTGGCTFFYRAESVPPEDIISKPVLKQVGRYYFCR